MPGLRARSPEDKALRRESILRATRGTLEAVRVQDLSIAGISGAAGLGGASLYTYFGGREEILLELFERELSGLIDELCRRLPGLQTPASAARILVDSVARRRAYRRLAVVLHTQLEPGVSEGRRAAFRRLLREEMARAGAALEAALPALPRGGGTAALRRYHALALGLHQLLDPDGGTLGAGAEEGGPRFADELHDALTAVLDGMTRGATHG